MTTTRAQALEYTQGLRLTMREAQALHYQSEAKHAYMMARMCDGRSTLGLEWQALGAACAALARGFLGNC